MNFNIKLIAMKKIWILSMFAATFASCDMNNTRQQRYFDEQVDSLRRVVSQRDGELDEMMSTLNDIQEGFRLIGEAEERVTLAKNGEGANRRTLVHENLKFIQAKMQQNRELIERLQKQLSKSNFQGSEMKKTIGNLMQQIEDKDKEIQLLKAELESKHTHIRDLDKRIDHLSKDVSTLKDESDSKSRTITKQDQQLHTAWYVFGTKSELKNQKILEHGKVLQGNFNKNYFTKIDIRQETEVKLYSKSVKILTMHPSNSFNLTKDINKQFILRILDPQLFWSTSKYLVIQVK